MKELSIEEKAKTYNEALDRAKKELQTCGSTDCDAARQIFRLFPELAENEDKDERIRKALITYFQSFPYQSLASVGICAKDVVAWLEKQSEQKYPCEDCPHPKLNCGNFPCIEKRAFEQGKSVFDVIKTEREQNPTDKVEPKFKVGDWLQYRLAEPFLVDEITEQGYINGNSCLPFEWENEIHLWSIQDAKDGDVLACVDKASCCPFIFHNLTEELNPRSYCGVNMAHQFQVNDKNGGVWCRSDDVRPATKEQRELLFAKMKEAGYEWDSQNNSLSKI